MYFILFLITRQRNDVLTKLYDEIISSNIAKSTFSFVSQLEMLDLSHNQLQTFDFFTELPIVTELYLQYNQLRTVGNPRDMLSLRTIDLSNNDWACDCNLKLFVGFMRDPGDQIQVVGRTAQDSFHQLISNMVFF